MLRYAEPERLIALEHSAVIHYEPVRLKALVLHVYINVPSFAHALNHVAKDVANKWTC